MGPLYRVVRVNTPAHTTRPSAFADMRTIIKAGYYWKKSQPIPIPVGTLLAAMGSHGGAGMFLLGISTGEWERNPHEVDYGLRIPVQWQPVIYDHGSNVKPDPGKAAVRMVGDMLDKFNVRFGAEATQGEFREVLEYVLGGSLVRPA